MPPGPSLIWPDEDTGDLDATKPAVSKKAAPSEGPPCRVIRTGRDIIGFSFSAGRRGISA
jgi:hypothetical protein